MRTRLCEATFGYSGGTALTPALLAAAENTDLFAGEACTYDMPVRYHLDCRTLCRHVGEFATRQLTLTHMSPSMLSRLGLLGHTPVHDGLRLGL